MSTVGHARYLPRQFQGDAARLSDHVLRPTLAQFPLIAAVPSGLAASMDEFLDRAQTTVSRMLVLEVRRSLALALAALFERQLALIVGEMDKLADGEKKRSYRAMVAKAAERLSVNLGDDIEAALYELHLVANVVRHGPGWSLDELRDLAPQLFAESDEIGVRDGDVRRYVLAVVRFWGEADHEFGANSDYFWIAERQEHS